MRRRHSLLLPTSGGGGGGTGGGPSDLPGFKLAFYEPWLTAVPEGSLFAVSGDHAKGLGAYANTWGAQTYQTTFGHNSGSGDYYGINNMAVVSGISGANGNCLQMRMFIDGSGKKVGCNPFPNLSGTPGASSASSAFLYGRYEARYQTTATHGWKTAWLLWPQTWAWTNEVDFPESDFDGQMGGNVHKPDPGGNASQNAMSWGGGPLTTSWHTVALEWTPSGIAFIVDGVVVKSTTTKPTENMFLMLQTENSLSGGSAQPTSTGYLWLDHLAVWKWVG